MSETAAIKALDALLYDATDGYKPNRTEFEKMVQLRAKELRTTLWSRWPEALDADMRVGISP